mmetsp:Transcript_25943/g.56284  ORF Transcript_25943/g.56284 Transcript_25943/m.56284 type:complete len:200 (-) Transcript_25943:132-731(-)
MLFVRGRAYNDTLENRITDQEGGHATQASDEKAAAEPHPFGVLIPPTLFFAAAAAVTSRRRHLRLGPIVALGMVWHVVLLPSLIVVRLPVGAHGSLRVALLVASRVVTTKKSLQGGNFVVIVGQEGLLDLLVAQMRQNRLDFLHRFRVCLDRGGHRGCRRRCSHVLLAKGAGHNRVRMRGAHFVTFWTSDMHLLRLHSV